MDGQDDLSAAEGPWQFQTPRRGRWSDALGLMIISVFVAPVSALLVILVWQQIRGGLYWAALGTASVTVILLYLWVRFFRQHWIHSIRFDGEKLWLGGSRSFKPEEVSFLKAHERPGTFTLSMINIVWGRHGCPRICLGLPDFSAAYERLNQLCTQAVKVYMFHSDVARFSARAFDVVATREGTNIVVPDGLNRGSLGFRHLHRFFLGKAWGCLISGIAVLALATLGATQASHALVVGFVVLLDLLALAVFWAAWQELKSWRELKASIPERVDPKK